MKRLVSLLLAIVMVMSVFAIIPVTASAADTTTVYFQNNWMWTDVNVYYWSTGGATKNAEWPGQPAQKFGNDGTYDVYSVTVPAGTEGVIFNGIDGGNGGARNQTPDIKGFAEGDCYYMIWENANKLGKKPISEVLPDIKPTQAPVTEAPTQAPTVEPTEEEVDGLFVRIDGKEYPVEKGATYTYQYAISAPNTMIAGIDVLTTYDTAGLDLVPYKNGKEIDDAKHFPALPGVVSNFNLDGEVYYNFCNYKGISLNNAVLFQAQFTVTADKGIFDIESKIKTMNDPETNRYVYDYEVLKSFTQTEKFTDGDNPIEPTNKPTEDNPEPDKVFVNVDGTKYEVAKGDVITYQYTLNVPGVKISSFDANTIYDTTGLDVLPFYTEDGEIDDAKHFPSFASVISNFAIDGEVYYNYANHKGTKLENAVVFTAQFKVTADSGVYDVTTRIVTMADTSMNALVYDYEKQGEFTEKSELVNYVEPSTTVKPTQSDKDELFVNVDGTKYAVKQGDIITYQYKLTVPGVKISSFDANTYYDTDGLDIIPFMTDGEVDDAKHFPAFASVISNVTDIDGTVLFNYANYNGTKLDDSVVFTAQFKVTASKGTYDITTRIKTMADTNMSVLVYEYEKLADFTEKSELVDYVEPSTTVKPTTIEPTEKPTTAPTVKPTQAPTVKPSQGGDGNVTLNVDGKKYTVSQGDVVTYQYTLNVPGVKISSFDANTFFDTDGLDLVPFTDGGEIDDAKHFPAFASVISNFDIDGEIYYNYANYKGVKLENAVVFTAQFKVTAKSGTYDITTRIFTMADTSMNALVYDYEKKGDFTEESKLVDYTEPTVKPTQGEDGLYLNVDGTKYAVKQGDIVTYQFKVTVPDRKVSSFDAQTFYDTDGIDVVPFTADGEIDEAKHFPAFTSLISNFKRDGEIYFNYSNHKGITLNDTVVFVCQFKVTAASGTYDITTRIKTMADTSLEKIVFNYEKLGEFSQNSELVNYVEPTQKPTEKPTDKPTEKPTEKPTQSDEHNLFLNVDGRKYAVEQGQTYTYQYKLTVPGVKISSFDARTFYDTEGMDIMPYFDDYGDINDSKHFPSFASVISNVNGEDGMVYFNYSNIKGVALNDSVVFTAQFKVTAASGTYDITTRIFTMADTKLNTLVYDYEKLGDFTEKSELVGYVEPTQKPDDLLIGDANLDGVVTIYDVTLIQRHLNKEVDFNDKQKIVADTNFDGTITIYDATLIQRYLNKEFSEFKK